MAITIDSTTFNDLYLTEQPFGYDESDITRGRTAQKWTVAGLMTPADWLDLLDVYDSWRDLRINDENPTDTGVIGTTVAFSGTGPGGQTFTNVECWFNSAPSASQSGIYLSVEFELVDALQALEILLKEKEEEEELLPNFGTYTIASTTLTLRKPIDTYGDGPALELTASGAHYITGPLVVYKIKDIEGETDLNGFNDIRAWYESQIIAVPSTGSYFPITSPTATAERKIISGVPTDVYTVEIQLGLVM